MPLPLLLGTRSGLYRYDFREHAMVAGSQTRVVSECGMRFMTTGSCSSAMLVVISECLKLAQFDIWCRVLLCVRMYPHFTQNQLSSVRIICIARAKLCRSSLKPALASVFFSSSLTYVFKSSWNTFLFYLQWTWTCAYCVYIAYGCSTALVAVKKDFTTIVCTCSLGGPMIRGSKWVTDLAWLESTCRHPA